MAALIEVIRISRRFPHWEKFELVSQIRAAARSVCSCIAEAWRKRNYPAAFASKLTEAESEAAETQTWLDIACAHQYITSDEAEALIEKYEHILAQLVQLRRASAKWKKN